MHPSAVISTEAAARSHTRGLGKSSSRAGNRKENSTAALSSMASASRYGSSCRLPGTDSLNSRLAARRFHQYTASLLGGQGLGQAVEELMAFVERAHPDALVEAVH